MPHDFDLDSPLDTTLFKPTASLAGLRVMFWILALLPCGAGLQTPPALQETNVRELFVANCAACHGELGDGKGTAQLEHLARSFVEGGFSYGNTPSALRRTIATGIPGTPMPAWGEALSALQIQQLVDYVIELGPAQPAPPADTELVVLDRALVVRGQLPPISAAAESHSRGLLVGTPDGFSFEYRTDDLRLLGMRQGRFVDRTDWIGRGGTALEPLGALLFLEEGGSPRSTFTMDLDGLLVAPKARLRGTRGAQGKVWIRSALFDPSGRPIAIVEECTQALRMAWGSGYERRWKIQALVALEHFGLRGPGTLRAPEEQDAQALQHWLVQQVLEQNQTRIGWSAEDLWIVPRAQTSLVAGQTLEWLSFRLRRNPPTTPGLVEDQR